MSRAFVKEPDGAQAGDTLPERPQSEHPNYITPAGYRRLEDQLHALERERETLAAAEALEGQTRVQEIDRDLRYVKGRIERAIVVDPKGQPREDIRFGATVRLADDQGAVRELTIVGEDEASATEGRISWVSPLARAMLGKRIGDVVVWESPGGVQELEVVDFRYD